MMHTWSRRTARVGVVAGQLLPQSKGEIADDNTNLGTRAPSGLLTTDEQNKNEAISPLPSKSHTKYGLDVP